MKEFGMTSNDKFLEILERNGLPTGLLDITVGMHKTFQGWKGRVVFYGIGNAIPEDIAEAIKKEVLPLIQSEDPGCQVTFSKEILIPGALSKIESGNEAYRNFRRSRGRA